MYDFFFFGYLGPGVLIVAVLALLLVCYYAISSKDGSFYFIVGVFLIVVGGMVYTSEVGRFDSGLSINKRWSQEIGALPGYNSDVYLRQTVDYKNGSVRYTYYDPHADTEVTLNSDDHDVTVEVDSSKDATLIIYEFTPICDFHSELEKWFGACFGRSSNYALTIPEGGMVIYYHQQGPNRFLVSQ